MMRLLSLRLCLEFRKLPLSAGFSCSLSPDLEIPLKRSVTLQPQILCDRPHKLLRNCEVEGK